MTPFSYCELFVKEEDFFGQISTDFSLSKNKFEILSLAFANFCYFIFIWFSCLFSHYSSMQPPNPSQICLPLRIRLRCNRIMASMNHSSVYDLTLLPQGDRVCFFTSGISAVLMNCLTSRMQQERSREFWSLYLKRLNSFHPCPLGILETECCEEASLILLEYEGHVEKN